MSRTTFTGRANGTGRRESGGLPWGLSAILDLISPSDWEVRRGELRLDGQYVRTLAVVGYPRYVYAGWLSALVGVGFPLDLSFHLVPQESVTSRASMYQAWSPDVRHRSPAGVGQWSPGGERHP